MRSARRSPCRLAESSREARVLRRVQADDRRIEPSTGATQATICFRRRIQPRRPPHTRIRPGMPAPTTGPGTDSVSPKKIVLLVPSAIPRKPDRTVSGNWIVLLVPSEIGLTKVAAKTKISSGSVKKIVLLVPSGMLLPPEPVKKKFELEVPGAMPSSNGLPRLLRRYPKPEEAPTLHEKYKYRRTIPPGLSLGC